MFVAQAHSFTQQARLAITLSLVAGYTNILTVLTCGQVSSHMSGLASELGRDAVTGRYRLGALALVLLIVFFGGAFLSGVLTELGRLKRWQSIYVLPIALEAVLLTGFAVMVELHDTATIETGAPFVLMTGLAAAAMGLQNATITRISGGVVRTTHVTGVLTDLGLESAQLLSWLLAGRRTVATNSGGPATVKRLALLASIIGAFVLGAALGALAFDWFPRLSMMPPVLFLLWIIVQDVVSPIAEVAPMTSIAGASAEFLPDHIAVFHVNGSARGGGRRARMPNLIAWADHLPVDTRAVVLDLEKFGPLDSASSSELRALFHRLADRRCALVLAGVGADTYESLSDTGVLPTLDPHSVCPDIELAVARAIALSAV